MPLEWTVDEWRADGLGMRAALPNFLQPAGRRRRSIAAAGCEPAVAGDRTRSYEGGPRELRVFPVILPVHVAVAPWRQLPSSPGPIAIRFRRRN